MYLEVAVRVKASPGKAEAVAKDKAVAEAVVVRAYAWSKFWISDFK
jgi:hypothetical protein